MIEIQMPRLSDTMEEGAINAWLKQPGDPINVGDILVEIETDKAVMEYEAYEAGTFHSVLVPAGETAPIGAAIALLDDGKGDAAPPPSASVPPVTATPVQASAGADPGDRTIGTTAEPAVTRTPSARAFSSPLARKEAKERGLSLELINGTGPGGRIVRADVTAAAQAQVAQVSHDALTGVTGESEAVIDGLKGTVAVPFNSSRKVISTRLSESSRTIPHFSLTAVADVEDLVQLRDVINAQRATLEQPRLSMNDFMVRACALALMEHPGINASYGSENGGQKLVHERINIGVAMASERGLVVPVIVDAAQKSVSQLGAQTRTLAAAVKEHKLAPAQMSGGTFTVSNLGMYGVESFTAIINPPEGAILAVGRSVPEPVARDGEVVVRHQMRLTLSADHRIIDGADGAAFLSTLTALMGKPLAMVS